ncbi:MAG: alpha/beta hydrolase [Planctomycetota bacterium]
MSHCVAASWMAAAAVLALATASAAGQRGRPKGPPPKQVVYKSVGDVKLRLFVYAPEGHRTGDERPAIVFFFGGGWMGGTPRQFEPHARYLAARGMVAMTTEYRVKRRHGVEPFACLADAKSAMRYARSHASELGIDPDRLAAGGGSAGGHLAAATAFVEGFDDPHDDQTVSPVPDALCLFNPVIDTTEKGYGARRLGDRKVAFSPVHHVAKGAPPAIVFHGTADKTVPFENVQRFERRMKAVGGRCELMAFEGKGHGFFNYGRDRGEPYRATVRAMDRFLASLGWLEDEPTIEEPQ